MALSAEQKTIADLLLQGFSYSEIGIRLQRDTMVIKRTARRIYDHLSSVSRFERSITGLDRLYLLLWRRFDPSRFNLPTVNTGYRPDKARIHELARELEIKAKAIIALLPEFGITEKKTFSSSIPEEVAEQIRKRVIAQAEEEARAGRAAHVNKQDDIALTLEDGKIRLAAIRPDGTYRYLDAIGELHNIIYTISSETREVERAIENLEDLLNSKGAKEKDFQRFFEQHPDFITSDEHVEARAGVCLSREGQSPRKPDFILKPLDPQRTSDLLELKLPSEQIYVLKSRRERLSQAVMEARAQLLEYSRYFDDPANRKFINAKYGIFVYRPRMFVIIGRRGGVNPLIRRKAELTADDLNLRTYDDVVERMKHRLNLMKNGRWS